MNDDFWYVPEADAEEVFKLLDSVIKIISPWLKVMELDDERYAIAEQFWAITESDGAPVES